MTFFNEAGWQSESLLTNKTDRKKIAPSNFNKHESK